jgi:hypothetical protein
MQTHLAQVATEPRFEVLTLCRIQLFTPARDCPVHEGHRTVGARAARQSLGVACSALTPSSDDATARTTPLDSGLAWSQGIKRRRAHASVLAHRRIGIALRAGVVGLYM